jgi:lambda repressor-like predicted transcriptional regulator
MMAEAIGNKPILPPREVRAMVKELGRDMAIEMLVAMISGSPMANVMSEKQKMQLCTALIAQALDKTPQPARRR